MNKPFRDRRDAGRKLATRLSSYKGRVDVIVLGLPRGGVPVALEIAAALHAPLDILTVRKLGVPEQPELAMGAVASGGIRILDENIVSDLMVSGDAIETATCREELELERRERLYRGNRPFPELAGKTVVIVDDGLATGSTMRAAIAAVRQRHPRQIVVAVPVGSRWVCQALKEIADDIVCSVHPISFQAVSEYYDDFTQVSDDELRTLLDAAPPSAVSGQ